MERGIGSLAPRRRARPAKPPTPVAESPPADPVLLLRLEGDGQQTERRLVARLVRLAEAAALTAALKGRHRRGAALVEEADILLPLPPEDELGDLLRGAWVALRREWLQRHEEPPPREPPHGGHPPCGPAPPDARRRHRFTYQAATAFDP